MPYVGWMTYEGDRSHPDDLCDLISDDISSGSLMTNTVCHPDDLRCYLMPLRWFSSGWYLILMTYGQCRMSSDGLWCYHKLSGWQRNLNPMSSGRLSSWRYLIRMTHGIMQYLIRMTYDASLSHLDDKTTFDWVFRGLANPTLNLGHG